MLRWYQSMTLDDLERPKRHSCRNKKLLRSPPEKFNEDNLTLSATKCWPMIPVSRKVYADIRRDSSGRECQMHVSVIPEFKL